MNHNSCKLVLLSSFSLLLTACGGGGKTSSNNQTSETSNPSPILQPTSINTENWQSARLLQTSNPMTSSVEIVGSELIVKVESTDISEGDHLQIYLNTDIKPETGFQFDGEAWEESGVDYLIEDGDLFKSTQNNSGWNWNINVGAIDYAINSDMAVAKIDVSLLGDICNNIKVGIMTRDSFWDISTFSPASSQMQNYNVSFCNTDTPDTVKPVLTILGANPLKLTVNDVFNDPGATALDDTDGDISNRIIPTSTVNTAVAGNYEVNYLVTDNAGNSADITRIVTVSDIAAPEGIVIDGNTSDWINIPEFSSSADAIMKVSDDEEKLYILVTSSNLGENTQIFLDTDKNTNTGLDLSSHVGNWLAGADYMIENSLLDKSNSNDFSWSWDYGIAPIEFIKMSDTLEIAIKKSDFNSLANEVPLGFVSRTANWNVNYITPENNLPSYIMQFPNEVNPVSANNDSITVTNNEVFIIDVLANDTSISGSTLTIDSISEPNSGEASIVTNRIIYRPIATFTGIVNFSYQISDGNGNIDTASIKVIVTAPPNNDPVANNDSTTTDFNTAVTIDVISNDYDPDGDLFYITTVSNPANGTAEIVAHKIIYTPDAGFEGVDVFSYKISDATDEIGNTTASVTVTVKPNSNNPPTARDDNTTTKFNTKVTIDVMSNDDDQDGDIFFITNVSNPANGTAVIVAGEIIYTPNSGFEGTETFNYSITDINGERDTATVTIIISENIAPIANDDFVTTDGIKTLRIFVQNNDTDPDGSSAGIDLNNDYTQPANGTVTRNTPRTIDYTPNPTFSGTDTFTYSIRDVYGATDSATVTVTVPLNNAPDAVEDAASVDFDKTITIDVLSNDTDPDNDVLSVLSIVQPTVGVATLNENGTIFFDPQSNIGSISIGYTVTDSRGGTDFAILTVASTDPNDGNFGYPVIVDENVSTTSDSAIFVDVLVNDSDPDGDTLILDQLSGADNGTAIKINGGVRYTPNPGFVGTDFIYYGVHDGFGHNGFGTVTITVTSTNPQ